MKYTISVKQNDIVQTVKHINQGKALRMMYIFNQQGIEFKIIVENQK